MLKIDPSTIESSSPFFQKIERIYFSFIALPLVLFIASYLKYTKPGTIVDPFFIVEDSFAIGAIIIAALCFVFLVIKYRRSVKQIRLNTDELKPRMSLFYTVTLNYYLWIEFVALLIAIGYFITAHTVFAQFYGFHIAFIAYERSTPMRFSKQLKIDRETYNKLIKNEKL